MNAFPSDYVNKKLIPSRIYCSQIHSPLLGGDKVDFGIGYCTGPPDCIGCQAGTTTPCRIQLYPPFRDYGFGHCKVGQGEGDREKREDYRPNLDRFWPLSSHILFILDLLSFVGPGVSMWLCELLIWNIHKYEYKLPLLLRESANSRSLSPSSAYIQV